MAATSSVDRRGVTWGLVAVAMVAFNQNWHVEEERPIGDEIPE